MTVESVIDNNTLDVTHPFHQLEKENILYFDVEDGYLLVYNGTSDKNTALTKDQVQQLGEAFLEIAKEM